MGNHDSYSDWLELMCWPLTRRGGHTATAKEIERMTHPGGPTGAQRRNDSRLA